jgi:hypothetical protein
VIPNLLCHEDPQDTSRRVPVEFRRNGIRLVNYEGVLTGAVQASKQHSYLDLPSDMTDVVYGDS